MVDVSLLRPVWHPHDDSSDAFDTTAANDSALFDTLDEIYDTINVNKALFIVHTLADAHVICDYLASKDHEYGFFDRGPEDAAAEITLERFEAGETRVLVSTFNGWWNTPEVVCRHVMYDCDLVVYAGSDDGEALDVRAWIESVCVRFPAKVRAPVHYLAASPALFGWNVLYQEATQRTPVNATVDGAVDGTVDGAVDGAVDA